MTTIVAKWGNSLGIRIPRPLAEQIQIEEGTEVTVTLYGESIIITPKKRKEYTLDELLEGMTPEHFHREVDTGYSVGSEVW